MGNKITKLIPLDKPLVVFDLESTGLSVNTDRIVEIAYLKINPGSSAVQAEILLNPEISIPKEATEVHGFTNEDVKGKPTFKDKASELWEIFNNCYYAGFNVIGYDLPMLKREFLRAGFDFDYSQAKIIDAKTIYHFMEPRTLSAAYKFYCGQEHTEAHSASADVRATADVLVAQLAKYEQLRDWEFIYKINHASDDRYVDNDRKFYWRDGQAYLAFSKHRGRALKEVVEQEPGFLEWILTADFSDETKEIVKKALDGELPKKS